MIVYFINKTSNIITIQFGENTVSINCNDKIKIISDSDKMIFSCYENCHSTFDYFLSLKSIISSYNFILKSTYNISLNDEINEVLLVEKCLKGNHLDKYKAVFPSSKSIVINDNQFCVNDEIFAKNEITVSNNKESKAVKVLRVFDILQSFLYVGVPGLIIFFGIWYVSDILTALYVLVPLTVVGVTVGLIIKSVIEKFNRKIDKINSKFAKEKKDEYVDTDSFFDSEYIKHVFDYNNK